ncbi:MAG: NADH dehydrogenase [Nitrospira sp.]|nr:NAD(P)/FAD-dependent oxidoreductase [Nitrospira sp.]ULA58652.1 MAG: NADH dehydrogenase [Nitrospira sp.]
MNQHSRDPVVIVGGGFGGLAAARALHRMKGEVILIDRMNHHLFQPLLYQVATAALSPADIAWPLRTLLRSQGNVRIMLDDVLAIDRAAHRIELRNGEPVSYSSVVLAPGARHSYFGHNNWEEDAPGLKTLPDALEIRERMLMAFEKAERLKGTPEARDELTFVIVGGGPTGVELAGALAEIGRKAMVPDFPVLHQAACRILLIEGGPRILEAFPPTLSSRAQASLESLGVTVLVNCRVQEVTPKGVLAGAEFIRSAHVIWAAGNVASPMLASLGVPLDSSGRVVVGPDLSLNGDPWVFVIGDAAHCLSAEHKPLPGLAAVAMQEGRYVAEIIAGCVPEDHRRPFRYRDRGMLATIGRAKAVAQFGPLSLSGVVAWLAWCFVHIFFLIGFRNRVRVMFEWIWYYVTFKPGARLIYWKERRIKP